MPQESQALIIQPDRRELLPPTEDWAIMKSMAATFFASKLLGGITSAEGALLIIQKGRELGIPPTAALTGIHVIKGKPSTSAELMLALIYRAHGDEALMITETSAKKCAISYKRRGWSERQSYSFTIEEAQTADLVTKDGPWKQYPAAMLRARCISAVARMGFPDVIGGLYTPEELGADVRVVGDSIEVIEHAAAPSVRVVEDEPRQLRAAPTARTPTRAEQQAKLAADLRAKEPPSPPATPEQRAKIALLERIYVAWWGPLRNVPEIVTERDAVAWIGQLNQLRKAPIANGTEQVSEEQYTLCVEMASELVAAGVDVPKFPDDLTVAGSYELYKRLAGQKAKVEATPAPVVVEPAYDPADDGLPF